MDKFIRFDIDNKKTAACVVQKGQKDRFVTPVPFNREWGHLGCLPILLNDAHLRPRSSTPAFCPLQRLQDSLLSKEGCLAEFTLLEQ
jgi:hypothetical protein